MDPSPYLLSCTAVALDAAFNIVDTNILIKANTFYVLCYMFK